MYIFFNDINGNMIKASLCTHSGQGTSLSLPPCIKYSYQVQQLYLILSSFTGIVVRNTLVTYDRQNNKIGFWKTNCSELWKRLNYLSPPPAAPINSDSSNTSTQVPPSIAPVGPPQTLFPGRISFRLLVRS